MMKMMFYKLESVVKLDDYSPAECFYKQLPRTLLLFLSCSSFCVHFIYLCLTFIALFFFFFSHSLFSLRPFSISLS